MTEDAPAAPVSLAPTYIHARHAGISLLVSTWPSGLPSVLHWGADLGALDNTELSGLASLTSRQSSAGTLDSALRVSVLPFEGDGWTGRPGAQFRRDGALVYPRWTVSALEPIARDADPDDPDGAGKDDAGADAGPAVGPDAISEDTTGVRVRATSTGIDLVSTFTIEAGGVIAATHTVQNTGEGELEIDWLEATLPVPKSAAVATDFSGRWPREKVPHSTALPEGAHVRQTRRGRDGHDAPTLLIASEQPPLNRTGELWAVHLGWSGDVSYRSDRLSDAQTVLGAGELLRPREVVLAPGETYASPVAYFAYSRAGLDGISSAFHTFVRARPGHPSTPRPLALNTWEAVYFDHDFDRLAHLADVAAGVGVERFVLDDGWFMGRRTDNAGLGDWQVDPAVWPNGLEPLADHVHRLGMQFGLWFEPEMVNLDSELARRHPDWLLHHRPLAEPFGVSWRSQHVLDIANPDAYAYVVGEIGTRVSELGIDFIKWDHNRDLVEPEHAGRPGTHAQTLATYRMIAQLKAEHPGLEIESCSSGGARTDLGILAVADRVWASDSNDPVERQDIQRWTQLILPPELVGSHVGPATAHSSGRTTPLSYRMATALMGSAGLEWDIAQCSPDELAAIERWGGVYKELRGLIHSGAAVHADLRDASLRATGYVARDGSAGLYTIATVGTIEHAMPERVRLHGLDPHRRYRVRLRRELGLPVFNRGEASEWMAAENGIVATGRTLETVGVQTPVPWPAQALVVHVVAAD